MSSAKMASNEAAVLEENPAKALATVVRELRRKSQAIRQVNQALFLAQAKKCLPDSKRALSTNQNEPKMKKTAAEPS